MSKKSSSGSLSFVIRWPRTDWWLFCVRRSPGKLLKLALWSSRRRLCELARRSRNSSVLGDTTETEDATNRKNATLSTSVIQLLMLCSVPVPSHPPISSVTESHRWVGQWIERTSTIHLVVAQVWLHLPGAHPHVPSQDSGLDFGR